jgi:penicillin-binding protein 2
MGPGSPFERHSKRRRAITATLFFVGMVAFLGYSFFHTQIVRKDDLALRAEQNRLRAFPVAAARGVIVDRNGELIAETVTRHSLELLPIPPDSIQSALLRLQPILDLTDEAREALIAQFRLEPDRPLSLTQALSAEGVTWVRANEAELPSLRLVPHTTRHYPQGEAVAHLVGYVAELTRYEVADSSTWAGYHPGQVVGKAGVERQYETMLGGQVGERYMEIDASGRVLGPIAVAEARRPVPGQTLQLTLHVELQRFIHSIFPRARNGAVVAIAPGSGEILALYSHPTFDPNQLIGLSDGTLARQLAEDPRQPLVNRAIAAAYSPGSTWNLATAIIGLKAGLIQLDSQMPIACAGGLSYAGRYSRCWKPEGHGMLDLVGALANSCNVYFYQLGIRLGLNRLLREGTRLGFARRAGIDLPGETVGTYPTSEEWYRQMGATPAPDEVMNLAVGAGGIEQTPLRMAQLFAAIAGNGSVSAPRLRLGGASMRPVDLDFEFGRGTVERLQQGLGVTPELGSADPITPVGNWKLYGQAAGGSPGDASAAAHGWFAGFAGPADDAPEIALAVVIENGDPEDAAELAARTADFYLSSRYNLATPEIPSN